MTTWHDPESASAQWEDAPYDEERLQELLDVARGQVIAYAPEKKSDPNLDPASTTVPVAYRLAQLRQAQNIWTAGTVDPAGGIGDGEAFVLRPHPLDWHVKQIIRPKGARPRVR